MSAPNLLDLVVQSKKALQHAESICSSSSSVARSSAGLAVSILASQAKIQWMKAGIEDQLQLALQMANSLGESKTKLQEQATIWDEDRNKRIRMLDSVLDSLASHTVPPALYQTTLSSSLFGSQPSPVEKAQAGEPSLGQSKHGELSPMAERYYSPRANVLDIAETSQGHGVSQVDRGQWKTLRDFISEKGINDAIERMESDRGRLEDLLICSATHSESVRIQVDAIRSIMPRTLSSAHAENVSSRVRVTSSPPSSPSTIRKHLSNLHPRSSSPTELSTHAGPRSMLLASDDRIVKPLLVRQETITTTMAIHLDSLLRHYEQIRGALREHDRSRSPLTSTSALDALGLVLEHFSPDVMVENRTTSLPGLSDEDMQVFIQDTEELPHILKDIEDAAMEVESIYERFKIIQGSAEESVNKLVATMELLTRLGNAIGGMFEDQRDLETEAGLLHEGLASSLTALDDVVQTYLAFQLAYSKLLIEMDRRRRSREVMEEVVGRMMEQLEQIRQDEISLREQFFFEQGQYLPEDLCAYVSDLPLQWVVQGIGDEVLPEIEESLLAEAKKGPGQAQ